MNALQVKPVLMNGSELLEKKPLAQIRVELLKVNMT